MLDHSMPTADSSTPRDAIILHQFLRSHFNEKARWALDWKRIPHRRISHLPGPHMLAIQRMTGQTSTPVLEIGGRFIAGSAAIIDHLDERFPERALLPADPAQRKRALEIQAEFDSEVGPAVRTVIFSAMIDEPGFLCRTFTSDRGPVLQAVYRAVFPLVRAKMARANGVARREDIDRAFEISAGALDRVARETSGRSQLVGSQFSVADLTCAALLAPLVDLEHTDMARPVPVPERVRDLVARFADHGAVAWVRDQYARHRPPPATG